MSKPVNEKKENVVKVRQSPNDFFKSKFIPKNERSCLLVFVLESEDTKKTFLN